MRSYISTWPADAKLPSFPRRLCVLGCTGSIGVNALDVAERHADLVQVTALAAGRNAELLARQAAKHRPRWLAVLDDSVAASLRALLPAGYEPEILTGSRGFEIIAALPEVDLVLSSIVGAAGFLPTLAAAKSGKVIALANKESLVLGGGLIRKACRDSGAVVLPVDSEHNALFQGLCGHADDGVRRLILTATGGPFRGKNREFLKSETPAQALAHPNWTMGAKVSIDSATLMNKGLEIIEACHLYGLPAQQVDAVVHPQSIVHSLVEFDDGSQIAHLGVPDMRMPIAYCLCFPRRVSMGLPPLDLAALGTLTFEQPDMTAFPCLRLAKQALASGESHPVVLNAANEVAVEAFLKGRIGFLDIPATVERALEAHTGQDCGSAESLLELDSRVRREVEAELSRSPLPFP